MRNRFALMMFVLILCCCALAQSADQFLLRDGDTVVFYGDSITEQRLYTSYIEMYTLTRFPARNIRFINSGVGGDKVSGGWAGPIDMRIERDVVAYHPTMMTIMLGMNDGYYRPYDDGIFSTYADGYRRMLERIQSKLPATKITLLKPSPYDDTARKEDYPGGYNGVMVKFGDEVGALAAERKTLLADFNAPVVKALARAVELDPVMAKTLVNDRVHPSTGVHWVMAESVLKTWNAPAVVTSVTVDAAKWTAEAANTDVTLAALPKKAKSAPLSWTQKDRALPLPFTPPEIDPFVALTLKSSDVAEALDRQPLKVTGLAAGKYQLSIDEQLIGTYSADELQKGIDLALLDTPMLAQSRLVMLDTEKKNAIEDLHFHAQIDARNEEGWTMEKKLATALDAAFARQHRDAQPVERRYKLVQVVESK